MTRHGRNCTAGSVYTYHEKKKDTEASGYGSDASRLGKDSIKEFDCCSLTLQPCREPVITPDGHLYDKEAIYECILSQKLENNKKLKAFEKQKHDHDAEELAKTEKSHSDQVQKFLKLERSIATKTSNPFKPSNNEDDAVAGPSGASKESNTEDGTKKKLPSFWIPSLTPEAKPTLVEKPSMKTFCPMSNKTIKIKDLVPVKFTPIPDKNGKATIAKEVRYMCHVTHDVLSNSVPCAVLKPSGHVVTMECVEKIIKRDWICPITGVALKEKDIIVMQRGGTGFAASGQQLFAKKYRPSMQT